MCEFSVLRNFLRALLTSFQSKKKYCLCICWGRKTSCVLFRFRLRGLQISQKIDERKTGFRMGEILAGEVGKLVTLRRGGGPLAQKGVGWFVTESVGVWC